MLQEILDYAERAKARILSQYREKPKLVALVMTLAAAVQEIEAALFDVIDQTAVGTAVGSWLDQLGNIVGEERGGVGDVLYRRYINARIAANGSEGTLENIIDVIEAWYGSPFPDLRLAELGRMNVEIDLADPDVTAESVDRLIKLLRDTRAAGVGLELFWQQDAGTKIFTFSSSSSVETSALLGFGDSSNPATGGQLRSVARF